jgi:heptosyltransferase-2/heptosyltransferase-3
MPAHIAAPLVIRFGAFGDMVLLTPLLRTLHRRYGQPCRVLGSGDWLTPLFAGHPDVQSILKLSSRKRPYWLDASQRRLVSRLRAQPPGPVYVCDDYSIDKIRWLLQRARVQTDHCVFANPDCMPFDGEHWIDRWRRFGAMVPAAFASAPPTDAWQVPKAPCLVVEHADRGDLHGWLRAHAFDDAPLLLLQPGNKRTLKRGRAGQLGDDKQWPLANWTGLTRAVLARRPELKIILCGAPPETALLRQIAEGARSSRIFAAGDELPLRRLLALCEHANAMVSVDTGPAQAAAALGCPLVVLYGAQPPAAWLPRSPTGSAVIGLGGLPERNRVDQISLDEVIAAWQALPARRPLTATALECAADPRTPSRVIRGQPWPDFSQPLLRTNPCMQPIVIRFGRLGDMLLLAPLLDHLHRGYGEACLLLGTGPWTAALYDAHPDVTRVVQACARHRPLAFSPERWRMLRALRGDRSAPVHVCETEPRALAKIRRMLALADVRRSRCVFLTDTPAAAGEHWIEHLLRGCGQPPPDCTQAWHAPERTAAPAPRLVLRDADRRDREAWLRGRGWRDERLWLVQPSNRRSMRWNGPRAASDDAKAWPVQHWTAVLRGLHEDHPAVRIVLCGAPDEAPILDTIANTARVPGIDVAARELPLRRLMALAEIADGMLSVDTGPAHVAAAMGCPLVVLFGAQSPGAWCPRSPTGSAVIALGGPPRRACVSEIIPPEVIAAMRSLTPRNLSCDKSMIAAPMR